MRVLICDDESLVRGELAYTLRRVEKGVDIVEASNALEALGTLQQQAFDVVFLDVRMPGLSGFQATQVISKFADPPKIVFVSAHEDHALAAFEHEAFDYLLKPVSESRLTETIARLRRTRTATPLQKNQTVHRLPVETNGTTRLIRAADIRFVRADDRAVSVYLLDECVRFRGTLAECEARLGAMRFIRVHRSFLVSLDHIVELSPSFAGTYVVRVDDRARREVPVSRTHVRALREALGL